MSHHPTLRSGAAAPSRRSHEQSSHPFFEPELASAGEPYRSKRGELASQLYDPTSTFASVDYSHSTRALGHMVRLGTTAQEYEHEDQNLGRWMDIFDRLASAEKKTQELLGSLQSLALPVLSGTLGGAYAVSPVDISTTAGYPASSTLSGDMYSASSGARSMTVPVYKTHNQSYGRPDSGQYAGSMIDTHALLGDTSMRGFVARREATGNECQVKGSATRVKRAQIVDGLLDTSKFATAEYRSEDDRVRALCDKVYELATKGIQQLHELDPDFLKTFGTWESVASSLGQSTNTLYHVISTTAEIVGGIASGMDSGVNKAALGGIERCLSKAAVYLQSKKDDLANTKATASKARTAAEDLRHNAHMILMAYIELQAIVRKVLAIARITGNGSVLMLIISARDHGGQLTRGEKELVQELSRPLVVVLLSTILLPHFLHLLIARPLIPVRKGTPIGSGILDTVTRTLPFRDVLPWRLNLALFVTRLRDILGHVSCGDLTEAR
ncbi:hypothetical protein EV715DRAFT_289435 [Schizophyllum commune]